MKTANIQHLIGSLLLAAAMLTGCSKDNSVNEIVSPKEDDVESNDIVKALEAIDGVRNVVIDAGESKKDTIYFFSFRQLINHDNPDEGTFDQQVALSFKGFDKDVVLYTHGYAMPTKADYISPEDLSRQLQANQLNVEHRYFGKSLPEPADKLSFTYFNAQQEAQDLHAIVQALKKGLFKTGKWASIGTSKDGITTALYAYYSDQYGWNDIDLYMPFCAPFLTGEQRNGKFTCMDSRPGLYLEQVCGEGYAPGSTEAVACQRLHDIPKYLCSNKTVRDACNRYMRDSQLSDYRKIVEQYNQHSPMSTGDLEKDITAFTYFTFYAFLFNKFSYVPFPLWAKLVPDPAKAVTNEDELTKLCEFIVMDRSNIEKILSEDTAEAPTRSSLDDANETYWYYLQQQRDDNGAPYDLQAFMELGYADFSFSNVDGTYLTKEQARDVVGLFSIQTRFDGLYPQDEGRLMRNFREWVATESTQNILFVYAYNDPWTGGRPDDAAIRQNPRTEMVIDRTATHSDDFLATWLFTDETRKAITTALDKYLK